MIEARRTGRLLTQPGQARGQLRVQRFVLRELLALLLDDLGGRAVDEVRATELAARESDRVGGALDLLLQPLPLGAHVDDAAERDVELRSADDTERRRLGSDRGGIDRQLGASERFDQPAMLREDR